MTTEPTLREALDDLEREVRWQLRNAPPGLDPMAGLNRRNLDQRFSALRAALEATPEPAPSGLDAAALAVDAMASDAAKQLMSAWFAAHENQPMPEGKAEVERLLGVIIEAALRASTSGDKRRATFTVSPPAQTDYRVLGGTRPSGADAVAQQALDKAKARRASTPGGEG